MQPPESTYDVVLVLDYAPRWFSPAEAALERIRELFAATLVATDILFLDPSLLVVVLHFDAGTFPVGEMGKLAVEARDGHYRVLKPMLLDREGRKRFYGERLSKFGFRALDVDRVAPVFDVLRSRLTPAQAAEGPEAGPPPLRFTLRYAGEEQFLREYRAATGDGSPGLFISSSALPSVGAEIGLALRLDSGQGPLPLTGRVTSVRGLREAAEAGTDTGYTVSFTAGAGDPPRLESFLHAVSQHQPWPESTAAQRTTSLLRLPVEYRDGNAMHAAYTSSLGRTGVFVESNNLPAEGAELTLRLFAVGRTRAHVFHARVTRVVSAREAALEASEAGFEARFVEPEVDLQPKLRELVGSVDSPRVVRAMIVDDDRFFRVVLGNVLTVAGFAVLEASDGDAAFEQLLADLLRLDLLVLDFYMPGMSGAELLEMVRSVGGQEELPVVILTGAELSESQRAEIADLGVDDVVSKSLSPDEILARLEAVLQRREQARSGKRAQPAAGDAPSM